MGFKDLILKISWITSHEHYNSIIMHLVVCNWLCVGRIGLGWAHDAFYIACHMFMHSYAYILSLQYILIHLNYFWDFSDCLSLSLSFLFCVSLCLWHPNASLLRPRTLFIPGHPLRLILLLHLFGSMMRMPERPSWRTFLDEAFILNAKSLWWTSQSGVIVWRPGHMPIYADLRVLLQNARIQLFITSFHLSRSRYTHCCHIAECCECARCP